MSSTLQSMGPETVFQKLLRESIPLQPECRLRLPPELMSLVLQYLPTESVVSLSLTCKVFYVKYFRHGGPIPGPLEQDKRIRRTRATLLDWLEKDVPELAYCHQCDRLHPWRARSFTPSGKGNDGPFSISFTHQDYCKRDYQNLLPNFNDPGPWPTFPLSFYTAHLVMNAVRYGPDHGPSLASFKVHRNATHIMYRVSETVRWELKAIDDELYVYGQSTLRQLHGSAKELRRYLVDNAWRLTCHHMTMTQPSRREPSNNQHWMFEDLQFPWWSKSMPQNPSGIFAIKKNPVRSCEICWTDFQIEIQEATRPLDDSTQRQIGVLPLVLHHTPPASDRQAVNEQRLLDGLKDFRDYVITITRWVRLGPCKTLSDETWYAQPWEVRLGHDIGHELNRVARASHNYSTGTPHRPGDVMKQWYGVSCDTLAKEMYEGSDYDEDDDDQPLALWEKLRHGPPTFPRSDSGSGPTRPCPFKPEWRPGWKRRRGYW